MIVNAYDDPRFHWSTDEIVGGGKYKTYTIVIAIVRSTIQPELGEHEMDHLTGTVLTKSRGTMPMALVFRRGDSLSPGPMIGEIADLFTRVTSATIALSQEKSKVQWSRLLSQGPLSS